MIRPGNKLLFVNDRDVSKTHMQEIVEKILGSLETVVGEPALQFMLYFLRDLTIAHFDWFRYRSHFCTQLSGSWRQIRRSFAHLQPELTQDFVSFVHNAHAIPNSDASKI